MTDAHAPARLLFDEPELPGLLWAMRFDESGRGRLQGRDEHLPPPGRFGPCAGSPKPPSPATGTNASRWRASISAAWSRISS